MSGPATSSSRRWVSLLSSSFAQCSEEVNPCDSYCTCATKPGNVHSSIDHRSWGLQAGVYGQCLAGKLTELEKGVCQKEFVQFNTCMQQAMVTPNAPCISQLIHLT